MKKFLLAFMMSVTVFCLAFGFAACGETENSGNTGGSQTEQPGGSQSGNQGNQGGGTQKPEDPPAKETDFTFTQSGNGFSVTAYSGEAKMVVVPAEHDGKPVTAIASKAFYDGAFTSITLPASLKEIGESAFGYCTKLQSIEIPNCARIGDSAFIGCATLQEITLPQDAIFLGSSLFQYCNALKKVTINGGTVQGTTFSGAEMLTEIVLGKGVTSVAQGTFSACRNLKVLTMPRVETGEFFMSYYFDLTPEVYTLSRTESGPEISNLIPNEVTFHKYGNYIFGIPKDYTDWYYDQNTLEIDGVDYTYSGKPVKVSTWKRYYDVTAGEYWYGPESWTAEFYHYPETSLEKLTITEQRLSTNEKAFENCACEVEILNKYPIKTFEIYAGNPTEFCPDTIYEKFRLRIVREDDVEEFSFLNKEDLSEADRKAIEAEGEYTITITREGKTITTTVKIFASSYQIDYVLGLDRVINENPAAYRTEGEDVQLKDPKRPGWEFLGWYTDADFQNKITEINHKAHQCYTLYAKWQSVFILDGSQITGLTAYGKKQTELIIDETINGEKITSIGEAAFRYCSYLQSVEIPASVTSIGKEAFDGCSGLTEIVVDGNNRTYHAKGNCLIETGSRTLILGCNTSIIPDDGSVTSIGEDAFRGCSGLTSITIPNSVISIGDSAFEDCSGLQSVTFGDNSKLTSIGKYAFEDCSGLASIDIPDSVTEIGGSAFASCSGLKEVHITDLSAWCKIDFEESRSNPLYYAHHLYLKDVEIKNLTIPSDIKEIKAYAFQDCSGLTSVTIPDSVTSIVSWAFYGCSGLASVTIGSGVTSIEDEAFKYCSGLTSVTIGSGVTSIGYQAFEYCSGLQEIRYNGTIDAWKHIDKDYYWNYNTGNYTIYCTDGTITEDGKETYYDNAQSVSAYVAVTPRKREF